MQVEGAMLQTLAGRLKWERTGNGIRVEIPARLDWTTLFGAVWLVFWSYGGWQITIDTYINHKSVVFNSLWLVGWAIAECYVIGFIVWSITGRTTLLFDPCQLEITRRVIGIQMNYRRYTTSDICNFRFVPARKKGRRSYPSKICFEAENKTRGFSSGISDKEAYALINRMREIHKFPMESWLEENWKP